ncbi:Spore coat protein SA [Aquisphaera giovannonii]|uniref:Spore coat protein SA n=1 Tax=Aquisphaera giovannonii TaxID=406548 RepID=A0A5B9W129_9BACT|nr:glycosyltransferase family 4 protein [Aquisphaera giovannonii]QEH34352.1 Spore coat protein SA [Aquisphaera giovannonii]
MTVPSAAGPVEAGEASGRGLSVGLLTPGWPIGSYANGIITYVDLLARHLKAMGHRPTIVASSTSGDPGPDVYSIPREREAQLRNPLRKVAFGVGWRLAPERTLERGFRRALSGVLRRASRERELDLFEMEESFGWADWLSDELSIPICIRLHGPWFLNGRALGVKEDEKFWRRVELEGRAIRKAAAITAPSLDTLEQTRAFYKAPLPNAEVIPSAAPVTTARWRLEDADPKQVLFIGRFDRHKGGDVIIDAFARVLAKMPEARLRFIGPDKGLLDDSGRTRHIEEYVRERLPGALESGRVEWLGFRPFDALPAYRQQALVTVVSSRYETMGLVVLEPMAMGCPVVGARVGGIAEIIEDGVSGLLHRPEDPDDLGEKILTILHDPAAAAAMGRQAAVSVRQRFAPERVAAQTVDFYKRTLGAR